MSEGGDPLTPEQRRRNVVLGLALGALSLALMVGFIILFSNRGLPKDPKEWKRLQAEQAAKQASDVDQRGPR
jgi:hypothetical protein